MRSHCQLAYPICVHWVYFPTMRPQWGHVSPLLGQHIQHMNISLQVSSPKYYVSIRVYIYCVHIYLHNIDWRHSYNIYNYIYTVHIHIYTHVPVSCINTAHLCPPSRLTQWPPCIRPPVDPWLTSSRNGRQLFRSGCADCGGPTNSWARYPLVNWQFANWKITIFKNGKSTINGSFSICNKLPGIRN